MQDLLTATPSLTSKASCTATWHTEVGPGYGGQCVDTDGHGLADGAATLWHNARILDGLSNNIELLYPQRANLQANIVHFRDLLTFACMAVSNR